MLFKLILAALLFVSLPSRADQFIDGALLGLDEGQLKSAVIGVSRLNKAVQGPRGLRGTWKVLDTQLANLHFDSIFFTRSGRIERIEQQSESIDPGCAEQNFYDVLVLEMAKKYGTAIMAEDRSSGPRPHQSFAWGRADFDVLMHIWRSPSRCSVLIVHGSHVEKDSNEL
jgi:hypothetical protein